MATLNIGGRKVNVDDSFLQLPPDQQSATVDEIAASMPAAQNVAEDVAKSGGVGLAKGGIGFLGTPGDLAEYGARGIDRASQFIGGKLGVDVQPRQDRAPTYGSADIQKGVEGVTGKFYEPKTTAGKYTQSAGEFVGNPLSYVGPGSLALKAGGAALAGLGSEAGGQALEGTQYETPGRIAGALAGGIAGAKVLGPAAEKAAIPTGAELKAAANQGYNAARNSGLELHPQGVASFATKVEQELAGPNHGFTGGANGVAPKTFGVIEQLASPPAGATITASNLDTVRKNLGRIARETNEGKPTADAAAASITLERLKGYTENLPANHIVAGDAGAYNSAIKQANGDWAAMSRAESLGARLTKAENQASRARSVSFDDTIRTKLAPILDNKKLQRGLAPEELAQVRTVHDGTFGTNVAKWGGKVGIHGALSLLAHGGLAAGTGGATIPIAIAGTVSRKIADALSRKQANKLDDMLRMRSPEYQARAARVPAHDNRPNKAAIVRALLGVH